MKFDASMNGPFTFGARWIDPGSHGFAVLDVSNGHSKVTLICVTRDDCDALIEAAFAAKDMLPETCTCADEAGPTACVPCDDQAKSDAWCAANPPVDGDARTPLEMLQAGLLTRTEFEALVTGPKPQATTCPVCGTALEQSGRCAVCTAVPIGEYPVSHLACGCQVQDVMPIGPGTPMVCERHGDTQVVAAEAAQHLASCGHPSNEDGECGCAYWPERAPTSEVTQ